MFIRDRLTWLGYLLVGYCCFVATSLGPIMPFLRGELKLDVRIAGLHFSAFALGSLLMGTFGDRLMRRFGSPATLWGGGIGTVCGIALLVSGQIAPVTILGAMLTGLCGSLMGQTVTAIMSNRFGPQRSVGIYECNIVGSVFCALAPSVVGAVARCGYNWRYTLIFPVVMFALLALTNLRTVTSQASAIQAPVTTAKLPPAYWAYFAVIAFSVASEWSVIFWTAEFMERVAHLTKADAATAGSVFLAAMFIGRIIGSRLMRVVPLRIMLPVAAVLATIGFLIFWLAHSAPVHMLGLALLGLGEANMYPLSFSAAIGTAASQSARAASRMSISTGGAIFCAPFILGLIAYRSGMSSAFAFIALLLALAAVGSLVANSLAAVHPEPDPEAEAEAEPEAEPEQPIPAT